MVRLAGFADFNPEEEIPSLEGKVIFVTGGNYSLTYPYIPFQCHYEHSDPNAFLRYRRFGQTVNPSPCQT